MKFFALLAAAQAIQYVDYRFKPKTYDSNYMWDVVHRDTKSAYDFATANVEKAMKLNPSSGTWPIPPEAPFSNSIGIGLDDDNKRLAAQYRPWEEVVKKGNAAFSDVQVEKALKLIPEPIVINGEVVPVKSNPPTDAPAPMPTKGE